MSTCTKWVDQGVTVCKNLAEKGDYVCTSWADEGSEECSSWADEGSEECSSWADQGSDECSSWADQGSDECSSWADQGSDECSSWADEGSNQCSSWGKCHWYTPWDCIGGFFCKAYYWVANWVCKAYYHIANWICQAYYHVANWVCQAYYHVANWICQAYYHVANWVCQGFLWVAKWTCKVSMWIVKATCTAWSWAFKTVCLVWDTFRCIVNSAVRAVISIFLRRKSPKIEHVFVLMLENRSFDHMLGFSGIKGTDIAGAATQINGVDPSVNFNIDPDDAGKTKVPVAGTADFKLDPSDKDPGHEFEDVLMQLAGRGKDNKEAVYTPSPGGYPAVTNSGFYQNYIKDGSAHPKKIMNCFSPDQLPVLNTLAKEFAVCDNWFSSFPGPTWPNRFFFLAASSGGLDHSPSALDIVSSVGFEGYRFENGNIFDLLDNNCLPWRIYEGDEFPVSFALNGMNVNALNGRFKDMDHFEKEVNKASFKDKFVFIEPNYGQVITGAEDYTCGNSMHPLDDVTRGEKLIKQVYETIRNSPHWEKSMLLIIFDEHGGFYDHVPPPAGIDPGDMISVANNTKKFKFDQLGVRVPAVVVSPLVKKGTIDHTQYDHTSFLATIERLYKMKSLTQRDKKADDFLHLFSQGTPRTDAPTTLPEVSSSGFACEGDSESEEKLSVKRAEYIVAQNEGYYKGRPVREERSTHMQDGFAYIALTKVLQKCTYEERVAWKEAYQKIETKIDVARFIVESKLKLHYNIDVRKKRPAGKRKESKTDTSRS